MSWKHRLNLVHLGYLSNPPEARCLYRAVWRHRVASIVEIGMGLGLRSRRLISTAHSVNPGQPIRFTGIDMFEARPDDSPGMTLKRAHRELKPLVSRLQLVPGDPFSALARTANSLGDTDLVVISADQDEESLERAWFYLPRMLHANSLVFVEQASSKPGKSVFCQLEMKQIDSRASAVASRRAA